MTEPLDRPRSESTSLGHAALARQDILSTSLETQLDDLRAVLRALEPERDRLLDADDTSNGSGARRAAFRDAYGDLVDEMLASPGLTPYQKQQIRNALEALL